MLISVITCAIEKFVASLKSGVDDLGALLFGDFPGPEADEWHLVFCGEGEGCVLHILSYYYCGFGELALIKIAIIKCVN